jgi:hypothetical protein
VAKYKDEAAQLRLQRDKVPHPVGAHGWAGGG